jgi:hypothetical protein
MNEKLCRFEESVQKKDFLYISVLTLMQYSLCMFLIDKIINIFRFRVFQYIKCDFLLSCFIILDFKESVK